MLSKNADNLHKKQKGVSQNLILDYTFNHNPTQENQEPKTESFEPIEIPNINLPKEGRVIKDIGDKFQVNPVIGTGSFSIPMEISPRRNGFITHLML